MQVGAQRVVREVLFPQTRRELGDPGGGVQRDALEYIDEVGVRIDSVQAAGDDQALDDADIAGAELGPVVRNNLFGVRFGSPDLIVVDCGMIDPWGRRSGL